MRMWLKSEIPDSSDSSLKGSPSEERFRTNAMKRDRGFSETANCRASSATHRLSPASPSRNEARVVRTDDEIISLAFNGSSRDCLETSSGSVRLQVGDDNDDRISAKFRKNRTSAAKVSAARYIMRLSICTALKRAGRTMTTTG